jgi:hypothetical protein
MGKLSGRAMAHSYRTKGLAANWPKMLQRTKRNCCPKQQTKGKRIKTRPSGAKETKNQRQEEAVLLLLVWEKKKKLNCNILMLLLAL